MREGKLAFKISDRMFFLSEFQKLKSSGRDRPGNSWDFHPRDDSREQVLKSNFCVQILYLGRCHHSLRASLKCVCLENCCSLVNPS